MAFLGEPWSGKFGTPWSGILGRPGVANLGRPGVANWDALEWQIRDALKRHLLRPRVDSSGK